MKQSSLSVLIFFCIFLSGCATQKLSAENRATVHVVKIDQNVALPKAMEYHGVGESVGGAIGGVLGAVVIISTEGNTYTKLTKALDDNNIKVNQILLDEFTAKLQQRKAFHIVSNKQVADATFVLQIERYGLYPHAPLSNNLITTMRANAKLINNKGIILWEDAEGSSLLIDHLTAHTPREYINNATLFKQGFTLTSADVVNKLLNDLLQAPK